MAVNRRAPPSGESQGAAVQTGAPTIAAVPRRTVAECLRRSALAFAEQRHWHSILQDAYDYTMPNRNALYRTGSGQKKADKVFDSAGIISAASFANRIQSDLLPPFKKFIKLKPGPLVPEGQRDALASALDKITDKMFAFIHASNFDTSINETLLDLGIGTGALLTLEGDTVHPLNFVAVPIAQIALEAGPWGGIGGVYRKPMLPVADVNKQWRDARNFPTTWADLILTKPETEVELLEATYRCDYIDGSARSCWSYEVIDLKSKTRIVEREYELTPWATPRWMVLPGENYGRGPILNAMPDIKTLNKIVELILRNAALAVSGVYTGVDDGVLNPATAQIIPGSIIPVASNGGGRGPSLLSLARSGDFNLANFEVDKLRAQIQRMLFDRQLPPDSGPVRSATEIVERIKELARDIGSPFGRLYTELIVPVVQSVLQIMARRGLTEKITIDGLAIQVQVISPLATEQSTQDVESVVRWLSILGALGKELVMVAAKTEDLGAWMGEKLGVPTDLMRGTRERAALLGQLKQMMAEQIGTQPANERVLPIGTGVPFQQVQTAGAAAGVAPFAGVPLRRAA